MTIGMQMPKLFLRGSFVNVTIKNLTEEQRKEVSECVERIKDDPLLQPTRYQFKSALRNTIKGDYYDENASDQEYFVAIWKAVVAAKFGWGKNEPSEETITSPIQRKKFFQSWVFNYLRQILNENKRSYINNKSLAVKPIFEASKIEVMSLINKKAKIIKDNDNSFVVEYDLFLLPNRKIDQLLKYKSKYFSRKIDIIIDDYSITINNLGSKGHDMVEVNTPTLMNIASTSRTADDGGIPEPSINTDGFNDPETIEEMFYNLSENAQNVLSIILDPPEDYINKYNSKPVKRYIQEYLGLTSKQVKDIWSELKMSYAAIIGCPD